MSTITLDLALDTVMQLPEEQQEILLEILRHRQIERRRQTIAEQAEASIAANRAGAYRPKPAQAVIRELRESLDEPDE